MSDSPATRGQSPETSMLQPGGKVPGHGAVTPKKVPVTSVSIVEDAESNRIISKFSNTNLMNNLKF